MVAVLTIIETHPGRDDIWQMVWQQIHDAHQRAEGFCAVRLFQKADRPERYIVLSEWEDRTHYGSSIRQVGLHWLEEA